MEMGNLKELSTIVVAIMARNRGANGEYTESICHPTVSVCLVNDQAERRRVETTWMDRASDHPADEEDQRDPEKHPLMV